MLLVIRPTDVIVREGGEDRLIDDIHNYLWVPVDFEGEITLRRLFELIEPLVDFWGIMLNENVTALVAEMTTTTTANAERDTDLTGLVVSWQLEKLNESLSLTSDFSGKSKEGTLCAIELRPVSKLAAHSVKIEKEFTLFDWEGDTHAYPLGVKQPLLIELYKAIFYELSFFGSPAARDTANSELEQALEDLKNSNLIEE